MVYSRKSCDMIFKILRRGAMSLYIEIAAQKRIEATVEEAVKATAEATVEATVGVLSAFLPSAVRFDQNTEKKKENRKKKIERAKYSVSAVVLARKKGSCRSLKLQCRIPPTECHKKCQEKCHKKSFQES